jgi:hypothetical protein
LPAKAYSHTVETLTIAGEMKTTLETKLNRKLFVDREPILQTDHGETIGPVDTVFKLVPANHRAIFAEPGFDAESSFPARA